MVCILAVDKARSYAIDFAEERFQCPNNCLRERGHRKPVDPPMPHQAVLIQFEDRRCAQRFDDLLKSYDPDKVSKIIKR